MKYIIIALIMISFFNCKNDVTNNSNQSLDNVQVKDSITQDASNYEASDIETINKSIAIELKQKQLIKKKDERLELEDLVVDKRYLVSKEGYTINFHYPLLNESFSPTHYNFNEFINNYYVNISKVEDDIQMSKIICDSIEALKFREERLIDYKIYNVNEKLISLLFYKENFYSGAIHPSYTFDCFNFNLEQGVFMDYNDFFIEESEDELLFVINNQINNNIKLGNIYYDCWEIDSYEFLKAKNNFVVNDVYVEFYFDDCVMCPSYTGTYSIKLPLVDIISVLKKYDTNPLVF